MSSGQAGALRRRVLLSGTMLVAAVAGYGRRAYGACVNSGGSTYQCSGAEVTTQAITANNAAVSTLPGFSVNSAGDGITITGDGALSYTDSNASPLTGAGGKALFVKSTGDDAGTSTPGSVTINTNGALTGDRSGIAALNAGTGALSITASGDVTGTNSVGIDAFNAGTGTNLSVTTAAGTTVSSNNIGINATNHGRGALTITANGNVTGTTGYGIYAYNAGTGTKLSVTTGAGTTVSGGNKGIYARNFGNGALTITANGDVTGTGGSGIFATNSATTTDLSVTTAAGTTVSGGSPYGGIFANNYGRGALTITANGNVTGTGTEAIFASNNGTDLSVTIGAGATVSGAATYDGIVAKNFGTGALTITVAANSTVSGGIDGIYARNQGTGALAITVAATGTVSGSSGFGIQALGGPATVTVAGTVNGGASGAINFDQASAFANRLELVTGAVVNGNVLGGTGTDTLGLSGTGSGSFNVGQLVSFEAGQKTGSGTWTLTGANTGITAFSVAGGTLLVNGSLGNAAFTVSGGTLGGTGTVGNTLVSGGTFAPGSGTPGSSMTVNGTLGFNAASTYAVNLNPATSSFANVSGTATLGGATVNASFAPGSYIAKQYTILTAGSVSGTFNPTVANANLPANFHDTLSYDATHAYLNLILSFTTPASGTLNGNQNNVANALINSFNSNGGIPLTFATLSAPALSQASGQPGASTAQAGFAATGQFINGVFDGAFGDGPGQVGATGFAQEDDNANAYAAKRNVSRDVKDAYAAVTPRDQRAPSFEQRWAVWATAYGGNSRINGDTAAGTNATTNRIFGTVAGALYHFTPDTQAGFALGGAGSSFDIANGFGGGRADAFNAAVYAKHSWGAAYVAGLLGYSWQDTSTDRTVTIAGIDRLHAAFQAQALATRLEGGWRYATPVVGITPYAALQATTFYLPGYGETATSGSSTFALNYASKTVTATRSELGAKLDKTMPVQGGVFTLKAKAAWAYDWNTDRSAIATFQTLPGATFTTNGAQPSANAALASLGAEMKWHNGWSVAGHFEGEFSRTTAGYAAKGSVRYAW